MADKALLIMAPGFPKHEHDTTCLPTQQLFVSTARKLFPDVQIIVISLQYPAAEISYQWNDVTVYALNGKKYKSVTRFFFWIKAFRRILKITKGQKLIGVLSFWCNETALIGKYVALRNKIPHKIWISGQDARKNNSFVRWVKPHPFDLVAMSHFLREEFFTNHRIKPAHLVPNAVAATYQNIEKDIDVMGAGSLIPLKQYQLFLEVIAAVRKTNPSIKVVLFGNGPGEKTIRALIEKLDLSTVVTLHAEIDHMTLMHWMSKSKILLHPSSYEGYSTVCLEALANGCHVVSFTEAEDSAVPHWHIVKEKSEMVNAVSQILQHEKDFTPVLKREIGATVKSMFSLFEFERQ
jgi:glycosyltransferase involved in cell wall biosynthesis